MIYTPVQGGVLLVRLSRWAMLLFPASWAGNAPAIRTGAYRLRIRQIWARLDQLYAGRLCERERITRALHDTLLQSFHGLMFRFPAAYNMLPRRPEEAIHALDGAISGVEQAI